MRIPIVRARPAAPLTRGDLADAAVRVCLSPASLSDLPKEHRGQVSDLAKAIQVGSGWTKRLSNPLHAARVKPSSAAVVAARAHQVLGPSSNVTPVDIAQALVAQGMDWVEPFAPGSPLVPFYGYGRTPRKYDFKIGRNTTTDTREDRIPFETLERLYNGYDVARICTRHAINSMRSMCPPRFELVDGYEGKNPSKDIAEVKRRLRRPDGRRFLSDWLAENMLNLWKFDSAPIFRQRDRAGNVTRLVNVSAKTIAPMLDYYGEIAAPPAPAFQQFIEGVPWDWLTLDDIIYHPFWPETDSPYGTPPLETVLINANTDIRLQLFFLQFFTSGAVPEAFAIAPEGMSSPDDLGDFEEFTDDLLNGDQADRYGLKWLPGGTELVFYKPQMFDPDLAEYVMRRTVAAFLQTPHNLGFTDDVNRASGDTQMDVQFRVTDLPTAGYYQNLLDSVIQDDWSLPVQIRFDTGRDREDRYIEAQAHQIYWAIGAESSSEIREKVLGHPVNPDEKVPLTVMDQRLGIIPQAHIIAVSGDVDPQTLLPKPGSVTPMTYALPGGGVPVPAEGPQGGGADPKAPHPSGGDPTKAYPGPLLAPGAASKEALPDEQTGDNREPLALPSGSAGPAPGYGVMPGAAQGTGVGPVEDPEEVADLRKWRANARKAVARGRSPRTFTDSAISPAVADRVWSVLQSATSREQVDAAFKAARPKAAGIAVQALDTGRVLLVQRTPDKHDPDEAYARWEFPGGRLDGGDSDEADDTSWDGALREWQEETGASLPTSAECVGTWTSPDGVYQGFVVTVPSEDDLSLDTDPDEVSSASWWAKADLDDPRVRDKVTDTLDRVTPLLKGWADQPRTPRGSWATWREAERQRHHRHTDRIVAHYAPRVERAMAGLLSPDVLQRAVEAAGGRAAKAGSQQNLPPNQARAVAAGTAGAGAAGAGMGAGAAGAASLAAALSVLAGAGLSTAALAAVLTDLYGDGYLQGAHSAAQSSKGSMPPWTSAVPIPDGYWNRWRPGVGAEASRVAGGGLADLLRERDQWVREISETQVNRIGDTITKAVESGPVDVAVLTRQVDEIVHDAQRAWLIAETELSRAMTLGTRQTMALNKVPMVQWLHQPDACPVCMENAAVSPIQITDRWPSGDVPCHPRCRCAEAPYFP